MLTSAQIGSESIYSKAAAASHITVTSTGPKVCSLNRCVRQDGPVVFTCVFWIHWIVVHDVSVPR